MLDELPRIIIKLYLYFIITILYYRNNIKIHYIYTIYTLYLLYITLLPNS